MPSFNVKSRKTSPITVEAIDADSKEGAIDQVIKSLGDGESVEILQVDPLDAAAVNPTVAAKR